MKIRFVFVRSFEEHVDDVASVVDAVELAASVVDVVDRAATKGGEASLAWVA